MTFEEFAVTVAVSVVAHASFAGSVVGWLALIERVDAWQKRRRLPMAAATLPSHVGTYRTNPRPQPSLPRKTPWWRIALWRFRDGPERLKVARTRRFLAKHYPSDGWQMRQGGAEVISAVTSIVSAARVADADIDVPVADIRLEGARMRLYDHDGASALMEFSLPEVPNRWPARAERASTEVDCPTCCAVAGEPCCPNEHP